MILACNAIHAQSPMQNLKNTIDTAVTSKSATHSITAYGLGTTMKTIADTVDAYYNRKTDSITYSRISGAPAALPPTGGAGGSLSGSYPSPSLAPNSVGYTQLNAGSATTGQYLQWTGANLAWNTPSSGGGAGYYGAGYRIIKGSDSSFSQDTTFLTQNQYNDTVAIWSQTFNTGSLPTNFSLSPTNTATWTSSKLTFNGNGNVYTDYIYRNDTSMMENAIMQATIVYNTKASATDSGFEMGYNSVQSTGHFLHMGYAFKSGTNQGKIVIDLNTGTNSGIYYIGTSNTNINSGDTIIYTLQTNANWTTTATINNKTQNWTITGTFSQGVGYFYNSGNATIRHIGGNYSVVNWNYKIIKPHLLLFLGKGNSIMLGQGASTYTNRGMNKIVGLGNIKVGSGGGDMVEEVASTLKEAILLHPKAIIFGDGMAAGNDILNGTNISQWQQQMIRAYNICVSNDIIPIICLATPRSTTDERNLNAFVQNVFPAEYVIDTYTPLHDATTNYAPYAWATIDGTHLTDTANAIWASTLNAAVIVKKIDSAARLGNNLLCPIGLPNNPLFARLDAANTLIGNTVLNGECSIDSGFDMNIHYVLTTSYTTTNSDVCVWPIYGGTITMGSGYANKIIKFYNPTTNNILITGTYVGSIILTQNQSITLQYQASFGWVPTDGYCGFLNVIPSNISDIQLKGITTGLIYKGSGINYTASTSDYAIQTGGGGGTITLPTSGINNGKHYSIMNLLGNSGTTTVANMNTTTVLQPGASIVAVWDGSLGNYSIESANGFATSNNYHTIFTPLTGGSVTLTNNYYNIINPSGSLSALTIVLPSSPVNNDKIEVKFEQAITTVIYSGGNISPSVSTSPVAGTYIKIIYDATSNTWY